MASTHHFHAHKLFNVEGYVAVITGYVECYSQADFCCCHMLINFSGGTGIGLMSAQALAANGAKVYITGRRMEALEKAAKSHKPDSEHSGSIIPIGPCDVTKKEDLEKLVKQVEEKEKYIHLLMCNAGVGGPKASPDAEKATELKKTLWDNETVEGWNATYSTDVTAVYFTTVAFLPLLQAGITPAGPLPQFGPSVITTSSMSGQMRHAQGHFSYNAAKGATVHLTKMMSAEFQQTGIRVNSVAPGYFPSEMTTQTSGHDQKSELPAEKVQEKGHVPSMRPGRDEEMGMTILYLAKNEYVNGMVITVDGGVLNVVSGS